MVKQIMNEELIIAQVEEERTGILFFISWIELGEFLELCGRYPSWKVISVVKESEENENE